MNIPEHTNCKNCGFCCCIVPITSSEDLNIRQYLPEIDRAILEILINQPRSHDACQFHDQIKMRCAIYPVRPRICRLFGVASGMNCIHGNTASLNVRRIPEGQPSKLMPEYVVCTRSNEYSVPLAKASKVREIFERTSCLLTTAEIDYNHRHYSYVHEFSALPLLCRDD